MKWSIALVRVVLCVAGRSAVAAEPLPLRILYLGNDRERGADFESFLKQHFVTVLERGDETVRRSGQAAR
jgi:hypothetical protein